MGQSAIERFDPAEEYQWYDGKSSLKKGYVLDYLYFFVHEGILATKEKFSNEYISFVSQFVKKTVSFTNENITQYPNAWYFRDLVGEKFLQCASKCFLARYMLLKGYYDHHVEVFSKNDLFAERNFHSEKRYYLKEDNNFAGRGNKIFYGHELSKLSQTFTCVVEEYLDRVHDFAITILPEDKMVIYENHVNGHGQYQGTVIDQRLIGTLDGFLKSKGVSNEEISIFLSRFDSLKNHYEKTFFREESLRGSFDFFTYNVNGVLKIHPACEFNPRWTMGRVAWTIFDRFAKSDCNKAIFTFSSQKIDDALLLSPMNSKIGYYVSFSKS